MNLNGWLQILIYFLVLLLMAKPVGSYMARVYQGDHTFMSPVIAPVERFIYRVCGVHEEVMNWKVFFVA